MSGAARPGRRGRDSRDPAAGLRALAAAVRAALDELVNDAAASLGTPAFGVPALAGGPLPVRRVLTHLSVDVSAPVTRGGQSPRRHPATATAPQRGRAVGLVEPPPPPERPAAAEDDGSTAEGADAGPGETYPGESGHTPADRVVTDPVEADHAEAWELVRLAQDGDGEAFGGLYDRYVDTVFRFIFYRVNDRALAEDFTSETFLRALRRIGSISYQGRDIGAWFVTIARNIVYDHMKSARHRLEITTADTIERNDHDPGPESAALTTLTNERLMAGVDQLGEEQRECVLLRFIQGFSVAETAQVMGKNDGAIKALQHRAIRKLAELVAEELR